MGKIFVPLLKMFTSNNYTVKDSLDFAKDITQKSSKLFMGSLNVDSLFTNTPLDGTIRMCVKESQCVKNLVKRFQVLTNSKFYRCFLCVILFDQNYCIQIDGVAMGSQVGPTLADMFLCHHKTTWLKNCRKAFKPVHYKTYFDDIFVFEKLE